MKEQNLNIRYMVAQLSELSQQEQELVNRAKAATSNAYANYSHFYVGAALLLGDGRIVIGANQENAAFPSGLCAERSAIFGAQSNYPDQPILEMEDRYQRPVRILLYGENGIYCFDSIKDLLPFCFVDSNMKE